MILAKALLAGSMLIAINSVALAQGTQPTKETPPPPGTQAGLVTVVNRVDGTIVIEPTKGGATAKSADATDAAAKAAAEKAAAEKVAAAEEASSEHFKIKRDLIDGVHAGDKVTFSVSDTDGAKTITKIEAN